MRLSIPAKVFFGYAVVLAAFGTVTAFGLVQMHRMGEGLALVSQAYHPLTRLGAQIEASVRNSEQATGRLLGEGSPRARLSLLELAVEYHPRVARERVRAAQAVAQQARTLGPGPAEGPFLDRVDGLLAAVLVRYDEYARAGDDARRLFQALERARGDDARQVEAQLDPAVRRLKKVEQAVSNALEELAAELDERIDHRVKETAREERQSLYLTLLLSALAAAVGLLVTAASQRILSPIRRLTEAAKDVGEGRFHELHVDADDELGVLAGEFNAMARKLAERDRQLSEKTAEALRAERLAAVGKLAAQITHEIRNPLSSLSLNAELLQEQLGEEGLDRPETRAELRQVVDAMAREVDRLAEVTEEYLRFARLPKPAPQPLDLNEEVNELLDFMAPEFARAGVSVQRALCAEAPVVRADPGQLRQVLLNLVRNAREAAQSGGHVRVLTRLPEDGTAGLEVADDGPGIGEEMRARIFDPFFSTKERGTGLGLSLVQQMVHEHGGEVACESTPGEGTRMSITLPLAAQDEGRAQYG